MSEDLRGRAAAAGYRLVPLRKLKDPMAQLAHALAHHGARAVIDAGANEGQYAQGLREAGWAGPIVSIEPEPATHRRLVAAAAGDPAWRVLLPVAVGAADASGTLEVSAESDMSSLLPQGALLRDVSPSSAVIARLPVEVRRLDGLAPLLELPSDRLFLKLDLQGGEAAALDGATGLLPRLVGVQVELALTPLYAGEGSWRAIVARLEAAGFVLSLLLPGYYERKLGRQLQVDGVFFRAPKNETTKRP